ncbi:hypothetical protein CJF42_10405 [Pseudoalteromonas sp. NBT06-2]|uniref:hypothetical protein n=1 Tax=Pseudoalteromonas sp. NBT06-2 TaxID=2025950 RepID=UPI000BA65FE5|nr:hypothetical protein [Pseudoalteromonas sp. NBT06-2]PAJ74413.1 hypothetical protein CJF42_10405 [Pseudoalteromonas sp. NBT06-2]
MTLKGIMQVYLVIVHIKPFHFNNYMLSENKLIISIATLSMCIGCSSDDTNDQQQAFDNNQAKWESFNIS